MMKMNYFMLSMIILLFTILFNLHTSYIHPIITIIFLILYSLITCLSLSLYTYNYMFSIIFFLIIISGMLIIFLYFSSLISNEQNKFKFNLFLILSIIMNFFILSSMSKNFFYMNYSSMETNYLMNINYHVFYNINKIYFYPFNNLTLLTMSFLLISLFSIIKNCTIKNIPLRKLFK